MIENTTTEFKREYVEDIKYAIIAFANTEGGKLYVGLNNDGSVYGVEDVDETMLRLSNLMRGSIRPDVSNFVKISPLEMNGKTVIEICVQRGTSRPYYLAGKGIRPEGVYQRLGAASVPMSESAILSMIQETSGQRYEDAVSINQDLTFSYASNYFNNKKVAFGQEQLRTLGFLSQDGRYTNLALLFSDQCEQALKLAVFQDDEKLIFRDRQELSGSILKQFDDACAFIQRYNRVHAEFQGMYRIDNLDYPIEALREALLNALVHRDYALSASTLVSIFENRLEIVSIGGLVRGLTYDDILLGVSVLRNPHLANVFYRLQLIEAYGTGVLKINASYANYTQKPQIQTSNNAFKVTLPNTNATPPIASSPSVNLNQEDRVLALLRTKGSIVRADIQSLLNVSQTKAITLLAKMKQKGLIVKVGEGRSSTYTLPIKSN